MLGVIGSSRSHVCHDFLVLGLGQNVASRDQLWKPAHADPSFFWMDEILTNSWDCSQIEGAIERSLIDLGEIHEIMCCQRRFFARRIRTRSIYRSHQSAQRQVEGSSFVHGGEERNCSLFVDSGFRHQPFPCCASPVKCKVFDVELRCRVVGRLRSATTCRPWAWTDAQIGNR